MPDDEITTPDPEDSAAEEGAADEPAAEITADGQATVGDGESADDQPADGAAAAADGADGAGGVAATAGGVVISDDAAAVVGADEMLAFGGRAEEASMVALESVTSQAAQVSGVAVSLGDYSAIEAEFGAIDHIGLELRVALSETEAHLAAILVPLESISALMMVDASAGQMADASFAQSQLETISGSTRELLDHISLTLGTDRLTGAEVTLSEARLDQIEFTMGMVADVAQGAAPIRVDVALTLPNGDQAPLSLVLPSNLLARIAEIVADAEEVTAEAGQASNVIPLNAEVEATAPFASEPAQAQEPAGTPPPPPPPSPPGITDNPDIPVHPVRFPPMGDPVETAMASRSIDLLMDVLMDVTVELGRSSMTVESVLALGPGSIVELDKLAGEPVDVMVNERLIARGEVVVVDENFGVRVTEIVSPRTRAKVVTG